MWDCFSFKKKYFMFTHWTKRWSKCSIDSFILTHFNLDFLTIDQDLSLAFRAIYRAHGSVLMKYNSCHFIIIFIHCRVILHGNTLIFHCNFCLFVVASFSWTSMIRLIHKSTSFLALAFVGGNGIFYLEKGKSTHKNYISKKLHKPWKSSVIRL